MVNTSTLYLHTHRLKSLPDPSGTTGVSREWTVPGVVRQGRQDVFRRKQPVCTFKLKPTILCVFPIPTQSLMILVGSGTFRRFIDISDQG